MAMTKRDEQGIQSPVPTAGKSEGTIDAKLTEQVNDNTPSQPTEKGGSSKRRWFRGGQQKPKDGVTEPVDTPEPMGVIQQFRNLTARAL